jgi:two-component system sensor histidine kinase ChvG
MKGTDRWQRWMRGISRIKYRLLLVNLVIVSVPLVGVGFARLFEREMLRGLEEDMVHQAQLLRQVLLADPAGLQLGDRAPMLASSALDTRTRIRLLDQNAQVVADSHAQGPPEGRGENAPDLLWDRTAPPMHEPVHLSAAEIAGRPEIKRALQGHYSAMTRVWRYTGGERTYLFAALPISVDGGSVQGVIYITRSTVPVLASMYRLRTTLLRVFAITIAFTLVLSLFLAWTISRPLSRLMRSARRIADGERGQIMVLSRNDEIGELARAIDLMARKLEERAHQVAEMAANISHEFKSPLTSIRGAAELLIDGAAEDPAASARFLRNILADAERLDRLLSRLLELSRLEADKSPVETVDYEALLREVALQSPSQVPIAIEYRATCHYLPARRSHLMSIVRNLLDNACQHATPETTVTVHVADAANDRIFTSVHNLGESISPANLPRVWDRFFTTRGNAGGTGLGLAIVASAVHSHGGKVAVTSDPEQGTTFSFELPGG